MSPAKLPTSPSGLPSSATCTGQCHRYHEYETRPTARIGGNARTRPTPRAGAAQPAPITSAVPSTGTSAAVPGYGVVAPSRVQPSRISPRPAQPATAAGSGESRRHWATVRATTPPTANSQARVGSEKNAIEGSTRVATNDATNDTTATRTRTTRYGPADDVAWAPVRRRARRTSQAVAMIKAGHTK